MLATAVLDVDDVKVILITHRKQTLDPEMIRFVGIDPLEEKILVIKSTIHYRAAFEPIAKEIIEVDAPKIVRLQMPPDQHRSTLCDDVACRGEWGDVQWSPDGTSLAFVSTSRDHKVETSAITGAVERALRERPCPARTGPRWRWPTPSAPLWRCRRKKRKSACTACAK